jgi:hypothetical protein
MTGQFMYIPDEADVNAGSFTSDCEGATKFTLDDNKNLYISPQLYEASTNFYASLATIFFAFTNDEGGIIYFTCSTTACGTLTGTLTCTGSQRATTLQLCPLGCSNPNSEPCNGLSLGTSLSDQCQAISLTIVPYGVPSYS